MRRVEPQNHLSQHISWFPDATQEHTFQPLTPPQPVKNGFNCELI